MAWEDGLDDFEKQIAAEKDEREKREQHKDKQSSRDKDERRKHHHHHHRSHRDRDQDRDEHRSKRRRRDSDDHVDGAGLKDDKERRSRKHHWRSLSDSKPVTEESKPRPGLESLKRDSWMEAPSSDVQHIRTRTEASPPPPKHGSLGQDFEMKLHDKEINCHLRDLNQEEDVGTSLEVQKETEDDGAKIPEVDYTFGDSGSSWRMTRLKAVYRQTKESGKPIEDVALERYGTLREFDDAREEELELGRRDTYGKNYVGKQKPSGDLFQERKLELDVHWSAGSNVHGKASTYGASQPQDSDDQFGDILDGVPAPAPTAPSKPDQTAFNRLKAQLMKAELKKDPKASEIRAEYEAAVAGASSASSDPTIIQLSAMDNRMLSSAPRNEVQSVNDRRGRDRGNVQENEDMTIDDMVAEERRTRNQTGGEAQRFAERIAKDGKFDNDLEYMDENATKLAKRVHKSDVNLRNVAINEYQKVSRILENCPLCHKEDARSENEQIPAAPIVSLGTRTYLTLPTKPELAQYSAVIVPIQHHTNLLHCDDDEWEEIRNFMKSLTRFYHSRDTDVIFYENAAFPNRHPHAAMVAVPIPQSVGETAPAFFKEAFLTTEGEWSQHKKIIDTEAKARNGDGRSAFRRALAKEMPYFHVWFSLDGGLGHVVEDPERWPKGDLFAREVVGGMVGLETEVIKKQGRWVRGGDKERVESFRKRWKKWDWTRVLVEG